MIKDFFVCLYSFFFWRGGGGGLGLRGFFWAGLLVMNEVLRNPKSPILIIKGPGIRHRGLIIIGFWCIL